MAIVAALQRNPDLQHEFGLLKIKIDVSRHADLSLADETERPGR